MIKAITCALSRCCVIVGNGHVIQLERLSVAIDAAAAVQRAVAVDAAVVNYCYAGAGYTDAAAAIARAIAVDAAPVDSNRCGAHYCNSAAVAARFVAVDDAAVDGRSAAAPNTNAPAICNGADGGTVAHGRIIQYQHPGAP